MLGERFDRALLLASELHRAQVRKESGVPYVAHLLAVCALALEHGADEDQAIAALLHDAVEDQGGMPTAERIGAAFGPRVRALVLALTDAAVVPKPPWRAR
jgi:(p)ppGpp synthase/HD superfamily hydrolase